LQVRQSEYILKTFITKSLANYDIIIVIVMHYKIIIGLKSFIAKLLQTQSLIITVVDRQFWILPIWEAGKKQPKSMFIDFNPPGNSKY